MFKKLKDKLAEEVKSSPQRIQQFAQAAQAAVTSASSSISDITNNDLFSIGDNDGQNSHGAQPPASPNNQKNTFQEVTLVQPGSSTPHFDASSEPGSFTSQDLMDTPRQRRLSNSSFASDVSFRLPSYESPSMYHLQSDMEVSASEAEERGFSSGMISLDRVTKEQMFAAYRRTQERYKKYRTQYADLARHYKLLERENAKARSVLVETQDKALRRISELREQCSLEQSAKAHLEKALRVDIEERNMKIDTLNTKIKLLQENSQSNVNTEHGSNSVENDAPLINLSVDSENNKTVNNDNQLNTEVATLNTKIEKLEMLVTKYKDSLKAAKEKNAQITTELQIMSTELAGKIKENEQLQVTAKKLVEAQQKIQELNDANEELQNKINAHDFNKAKEKSTFEIDLQKAQEEIVELQKKIDVFTKREEENAISLAENKLSIHKELESKEAEIKSLKSSLSGAKTEIQSLNIVVGDYKNSINQLEEERTKLNNEINELNMTNMKVTELESQLQSVTQKLQALESSKSKADEEYKCLQLQFKQEAAEKLAMIDRNTYLESRNSQLTEENAKKSKEINNLDIELQKLKQDKTTEDVNAAEIEEWKNKCSNLELEIQEEREELGKLQSEIEKLLYNHELVQEQNIELNGVLGKLKSENELLLTENNKIKSSCITLANKVKGIRNVISTTSQDVKLANDFYKNSISDVQQQISLLLKDLPTTDKVKDIELMCEKYKTNNQKIQSELTNVTEQYSQLVGQLETVKQENEALKSNLGSNNEIQCKYKKLSQDHADIVKKLEILQKENEKLKEEINSHEQVHIDLTKFKEQHSLRMIELEYLQKENEQLKIDSTKSADENTTLTEKLELFMSQNCVALEEVDELKEEKNNLISKLDEFKAKYQQLQLKLEHDGEKRYALKQNIREMGEKIQAAENENKALNKELCNLKKLRDNYNLMADKVKNLEEENIVLNTEIEKIKKLNADSSILIEKLKNMEDENISLKTESESLRREYKDISKKIDTFVEVEAEKVKLESACKGLKNENEKLTSEINNINDEKELLNQKLNDIEEKVTLNDKLQTSVRELTQDNITLKSQCETIANNIKILEGELSEVRKSHTEIEIEKDRLSTVIEQLERNEQKNDVFEKDTQTNNIQEPIEELAEVKIRSNVNAQPHNEQKIEEIPTKYNTLQEGYNSLKEENRRLQSDISGLQTYLTQVSNENSVLNDKIRELIVSENSTERSPDINNDRGKIDDLLRENTLLIDENLELKDQLSSQNQCKSEIQSSSSANTSEYLILKEKYDNLVDTNEMLEARLKDVDVMNKSVGMNMQQLQDQNNKLRLSNEKLERRLDEALVSLRHLHSLQENTELEYLRNILYEYLTGSGTHSETLAKVLAAVVKFDDAQTRQVLLKEKERQGILRQLGLI